MKKILVILVMLIFSLTITSLGQPSPQINSINFGNITYIPQYSSEKSFFISINDLISHVLYKTENYAYVTENFLGDKECNEDSIKGQYKILNVIDTIVTLPITKHINSDPECEYKFIIFVLLKNNKILYYNFRLFNRPNPLMVFAFYNDYMKNKYFKEPEPKYINWSPEVIISTTTSGQYKIVISRNHTKTKYFSRTYKNGKLISETITQY